MNSRALNTDNCKMDSQSALKQNDKTNIHCHLSTYEEEMNALAKDQFVNRVVHLKDSIGTMQTVLKALRSQSEDENSNLKCDQAASHHCSLACNMMRQKSSIFDTTIQEWIAEKRKEISSLKNLLPNDSMVEDPEELIKRAGNGKFMFFQLMINPDRTLNDLTLLTGKAMKENHWFYQIYTTPTEVQTALKNRLQGCSALALKQSYMFGICSSTLYPDGSFVRHASVNPTNSSTYVDNSDQREQQMDFEASNGCPSTSHGFMHSSSSNTLVPQLSPPIARQPNDQFSKSPSNQNRDDDWTVQSQLRVAVNNNQQLPSASEYLSVENDVIQREENVPSSVYRGPKCGRIAEVFVKGSRMLEEGRPSVYQLEAIKCWSESNPFRWYQVGEADNSVPHKTIMLLGATGAGKSTLVNALFNYALGVEWGDPFRFKVVPEESQVNQALSQTRHVTAYTLHHAHGFRVPYSLTVIDTPGFGDTEGLKRDEEINQIICKFLTHQETKFNDINAICFVASSANSRLTQTQKYILTSGLSLFGNDVRPNIRLLATFSDGGVPPVVEACREAGFPLAEDSGTVKFGKFNNSALYASNGHGDYAHIDEAYWNMAVKGFNSFFQDLESLPTKSLEQTKKFIRQRVVYVGKMKMFEEYLYFYLNKMWDVQRCLNQAEDNFRKFQEEEAEKSRKKRFYQYSFFDEQRNCCLQLECHRFSEDVKHIRIEMGKLFFMLSEASEELKSIGLLHTAPTFEDCFKMMYSRLEKEASSGSQDKMKILSETFQDWQRKKIFKSSPPSTVSHGKSKPNRKHY